MMVLLDFPVRADIRSLSPFVYKAEALLALCGCDYRKEDVLDVAVLPHGKVPVLRDGDSIIPDSSLIQRHLEQHYGLNIDAGLTELERAMAEAFRQMAEEHLRWAMIHARWVDPAGEAEIIEMIFGTLPEAVRRDAFLQVREALRQALYMHGMGRHSSDDIYAFGCKDLDAIATFLDDKPFFMGDRPTSVDAFLAGLLINMLTTRGGTALTRHAQAIPAFAQYVARFEREVFGDRAMLPESLADAQAA
jgi:glutathione S-transferase